MKRSLLILLIGLVTFSCQDKEPRTDFVINGEANDVYNGIRVYMGQLDQRGLLIATDTAIVMNEAFSFKGSVNNPTLYHISVNGVNGRLPIMVENTDLNLKIDKANLMESVITGSESQKLLEEYNFKLKVDNDALQRLYKSYSQARTVNDTSAMNADMKKIEVLSAKLQEYPYDFIDEHNDSYIALQLFENLLQNRNMDVQRVVSTFEILDEDLKKSSKGMILNGQINTLKLKLEAEKATAIGAKAPSFSAPNPEGKDVALADVVSKGKVTIIDFWAAWCGPCRRENPNVVKVYNEFHDKGLEIIGVSLDGRRGQKEPKQAWVDAIEKDGLTWHQVSNLRYFDELAKSYNVNAIPAMFVLDENGVIIAKNLRGQALYNKISELLN